MSKLFALVLFAFPVWAAPVLFYTNANGQYTGQNFAPNSSNFNGTHSQANDFNLIGTLGEANENWSANADLIAGTLRVTTGGGINPGSTEATEVYANAFAGFGDTVTYSGNSTGGLNLSARVQITGVYSAFTSQGASVQNSSYLRVLFLKNGSFDTPSFFAPANVIAQAVYGIGPDQVDFSSFLGPYTGFVDTFPGSVTLPVALSDLPSTFQVAFLIQSYVVGQMPYGGEGVGWSMNLGNTLHVDLVAPEGISLASAGGIPTAIESGVPEPASLSLAACGLAAILIRRRFAKR